jgi:hypothetical protein
LLSFPPGNEMFQFPGLATLSLWIQLRLVKGSRDQRLFDGFPGLIAVFHARRRLLAPRHPPRALSSLAAMIDRSMKPPKGRWHQGSGLCVLLSPRLLLTAAGRSNDPCSLRLLQSLCRVGSVVGDLLQTPPTHATLFPPPLCQRTTINGSARSVPMGREPC